MTEVPLEKLEQRKRGWKSSTPKRLKIKTLTTLPLRMSRRSEDPDEIASRGAGGEKTLTGMPLEKVEERKR